MNREDNKTAAIHGGVLVELPLGDAAPNFDLEKAVCSHGLFMMAPNHWDPPSKTLRRPLRSDPDGTSLVVHVSHPPHSPSALHVRVFGTEALSPHQHRSLLAQIKRMLRLSDEENRRVIEFHKLHEESKGRGFGRLFRSPTLFEDIIKCMLLCNCQWSRTLSMAQALCELQAELQQNPVLLNVMTESGTTSNCQKDESRHFVPKTPAGKESKRKCRARKCAKNLAKKYSGIEETKTKFSSTADILECPQETGRLNLKKDKSANNILTLEGTEGRTDSDSVPDLEGREDYGSSTAIGNFPSPRELANLDDEFLARRCNLGYRARRVINLARGVIEGRIQLRELEFDCVTLSLSSYDRLAEKLRVIDGFGPYTCANVLMCMGYYHVVPTDSETIRHLKQVHGKSSTIRTIEEDIKNIYGKYAPFQFLVYWWEVWHFYEEWFGKLSEMPRSSYKLITAANMKSKKERGRKKIKLSAI